MVFYNANNATSCQRSAQHCLPMDFQHKIFSLGLHFPRSRCDTMFLIVLYNSGSRKVGKSVIPPILSPCHPSLFPSPSIHPVHQSVSQCFRAVGSLAACLPLHHWPSSFISFSSYTFFPHSLSLFFTCSFACFGLYCREGVEDSRKKREKERLQHKRKHR